MLSRSKFPIKVHILRGISKEVDGLSYFFRKCQRVTKESTLYNWPPLVQLQIAEVSEGRPYVFEKDNSAVRTSRLE